MPRAALAGRLRPQPCLRECPAPSCRGPGACPEPGTARRRAPRPSSPPPRPPPGRPPGPPVAALITVWPVGSGRPGCAPWYSAAASRLVLCSRRRRRPRALPPSRPACLPSSLARSLPPLAVALPLSASSAGSPPPTPSLRLPPSLPPAARGPRPPPAARPPRPRWPWPRRCEAGPGGSADWGAPGRRGGSGLGVRPVLAPSARLLGLCGPAGGPRKL